MGREAEQRLFLGQWKYSSNDECMSYHVICPNPQNIQLWVNPNTNWTLDDNGMSSVYSSTVNKCTTPVEDTDDRPLGQATHGREKRKCKATYRKPLSSTQKIKSI